MVDSSKLNKVLSKISWKLLLICIPLSALLVGGNRDWAVITITLITMAALLSAGYFPHKYSCVPLQSKLGQVLCVASVATFLQIIPIPPAWIALISSGTYDILSMAKGTDFPNSPLSLDVAQTQLEFVKLATALALVGVVIQRRLTKGTDSIQRQLSQWVAVSGTIVMGVALLHFLLGFEKTYGLYSTHEYSYIISSFVNPNHLASFLGLSAFASISAFTLARRAQANNWLWLINAAFLTIGLFLTLSRAGIYLFLLVSVLLGLTKIDSLKTRVLGSVIAFLPPFIGFGLLLSPSFLPTNTLTETLGSIFNPGAFSKTQIWSAVPQIMSDFPLFGVGRGAFISIFPKYSDSDTNLTYTHLENEYLQILTDWGPIIGTLILVLLFRVFLSILQNNKTKPECYPILAGICFIALHNFIDFSLSTMGLLMPTVAFLASVEFISSPKTIKRARNHFWATGLVIITLLIASQTLGHELFDETKHIQKAMNQGQKTNELIKQTQAAISRHPGDYFFHLLETRIYREEPKNLGQALKSVNRALYLAPTQPAPHLEAARTLLAMGYKKQSMLEYRVAIRHAPHQSREVIQEIIQRTDDLEALISLAGLDEETTKFVAIAFNERKRFDLTIELFENILNPTFYHLALKFDAENASRNFDAAILTSKKIQKTKPYQDLGYRYEARIRTQQNNIAAALESIDRGLQKLPNHKLLKLTKGHLFNLNQEWQKSIDVLKSIQQSELNQKSKSKYYFIIGQNYQELGSRSEAIRHLESAVALSPLNTQFAQALLALFSVDNNPQATIARVQQSTLSDLVKRTLLNQLTK